VVGRMLNCEQSRRRVDCMAATVLSHQRACWLAGFGTAIPFAAFIGLPDLSRIFLNVGVSTLDSNPGVQTRGVTGATVLGCVVLCCVKHSPLT
jgi:hypothetical protein